MTGKRELQESELLHDDDQQHLLPPTYEDVEQELYVSTTNTGLTETTEQQPQQQANSRQQETITPSSTEPVRLTLVNPQRPQNGFSMAIPSSIHKLSLHPVDAAKWTKFVQELNSILAKMPGSLVNNVADFCIINMATLGMVSHVRDMYNDHVFNRAMQVVEKYNRVEFTQFGITARLRVFKDMSVEEYDTYNSHSAINTRFDKSEDDKDTLTMLDLIFKRA